MTATVDELIDRTLRDWLEPADDQPTRLTLTADVTVNGTTLHYDPDMIGPEELELLAAGTLIQIGSEELLVGAVDETTNQLTGLLRGVNGTDAQTHASGDFVYPNPIWRRRVIFDAICDGVVNLWPDLWRVATSDLVTVGTNFTEIPEDDVDLIVAPLYFLSATTPYGRTPLSDGDFFPVFPPSSTGKAFTFPMTVLGGSGYLIYKAKFARPLYGIDDLTEDFGIAEEWYTIILLDAVAYLVAGRELDLATQERLSKQLEEQNFPAGTPSKIRDALLRYRSFLLEGAKAALRIEHPARVSMSGMW